VQLAKLLVGQLYNSSARPQRSHGIFCALYQSSFSFSLAKTVAAQRNAKARAARVLFGRKMKCFGPSLTRFALIDFNVSSTSYV
jgi:hypothetical protein